MYVLLEENEHAGGGYIVYADWLFTDLQNVEDYLFDNNVTSEVIVASITPKYRMYGVQHLTIEKEAL